MHEATDRQPIESTLWELANAIHEVTSSEDESFAVLESMLGEGRLSVLSDDRISVLPMAPACAA
jgi:hypothetical protein